MKKNFLKLISLILVLMLLSSCVYKNADSVSSDITKNESKINLENEFLRNQFEVNFQAKKFDELSKEKISEISACVKKDNYEYQEGAYFGTYSQYDIVLIFQIDGVEYRDVTLQKIAGYGYRIGDTEKLIAYKDDSYIPLSEAYNKGIITKNDIQNICYLYQYSDYDDFADNQILANVKKRDNGYSVGDFSVVKIEKIDTHTWDSNPHDQWITITLPIRNRRNVFNAIEKLKKLDYILHAEPNYYISPA